MPQKKNLRNTDVGLLENEYMGEHSSFIFYDLYELSEFDFICVRDLVEDGILAKYI